MTHANHENCQKFFVRLSELVDGELDGVTEKRILDHMGDCPECRTCLATFKKSVEIFKNLDDEPIPAHVFKDLKAFLDEEIKKC